MIVESFDNPVALDWIWPLVDVASSQEIRIFAAGEARKPDKEIVVETFMATDLEDPAAMMVVPSHSLHWNVAVPVVSISVTVPEANHVPDVPCATEGPSKKVPVLLRVIGAASVLAIGVDGNRAAGSVPELRFDALPAAKVVAALPAEEVTSPVKAGKRAARSVPESRLLALPAARVVTADPADEVTFPVSAGSRAAGKVPEVSAVALVWGFDTSCVQASPTPKMAATK